MTDADLLRVYEGNGNEGHVYGLRAVYERGRRDGATQQRDMPPTDSMLRAADDYGDTRTLKMVWRGRCYDLFTSMQRAAPLVTDHIAGGGKVGAR